MNKKSHRSRGDRGVLNQELRGRCVRRVLIKYSISRLAIITGFFTLLLPKLLLAQENVGLSYLGICHPNWPCKESIAAYSGVQTLRVSFLYDRTFSDDCSCIREIYKDPRNKLTRIHLSNGPGLRNKRLQPEEIFFGYNIATAQKAILADNPELKSKFEVVAKRAAADYQQSIGTNELYVSTCLECNFSKSARQKLIEWIKPFFPRATFVDNPLRDSCLPGLVCEKHNESPTLSSPCIADLDGKDFESVNLPQYVNNYKFCLVNYLWGYKFNLIDIDNSTFIPPKKRVVMPDAAYFKKVSGYLKK